MPDENLSSLSVTQLKKRMKERGIDAGGCTEARGAMNDDDENDDRHIDNAEKTKKRSKNLAKRPEINPKLPRTTPKRSQNVVKLVQKLPKLLSRKVAFNLPQGVEH